MFRVKSWWNFVKILLIALFFSNCCSVEPETNANSTRAQGKKNIFVFRRQNYNKSIEKIQLMENETMIKSSYVPMVSDDGNHSKTEKYLGDESKLSNIPTSISKKENIIIKNGKKYRVIKVRKPGKNSENQEKPKIQRRTFTPVSNLLTILPLKWMTRQKKNETVHETRSENGTQWSKLIPVEEERDSDEVDKNEVYGGEKIKKLLNLLTIVKFDNGECQSDGITGTCLHESECEAKGGKFDGRCAGDVGVCCYSEKTCGETSNDNTTYFVNEGFPQSSSSAPKVCTLTIEKTNPQVKQLRLDFEIFQVQQPTNGTCLHDRLVISGHDLNDIIPEICGKNTGQHIYVDVQDSNGPFNLNIVMMAEYFPRNFRLKITQVKQGDELSAPKNCLQYFAEPAGYIQSFNYHHDVNENMGELINGYFNNLNYAICIKKQKGFCSISYENEETDSSHPTFQLVNVDEEGERLLAPRQAGAETFDCPDDYIIIGGVRLCGEKLNDATIEVDYTRNYPVTDTSNGPFIFSMRTDAVVSGRGFYLKYMQNPCLT